MKIPVLFKKRKKLEATARRAVPTTARDFDEGNMKLSNAVIVVLILHLVAVGGIWAGSSIRAHRAESVPDRPEKKENSNGAAKPVPGTDAADPEAAQKVRPPAAANASVKTSGGTSSKSATKDSGESYTVVKGDKLATIAKKLHVSSDSLIKLNKISDPTKLQIGQKLRIPSKRTGSDS